MLSEEDILSVETSLPDPELDRVCRFLQTLADLQGRAVVDARLDLDQPNPVEAALTRFTCYEKDSQLQTLYLTPDIESRIGSWETVDFMPRVSRSGKQSRHGVFFGDLDFDGTRQLPIAVKAHEGDGHNVACLRECFNNIGFQKLGINCLKPAGVILGRDRSYFLTQLDEILTTLDTVDWSRFQAHIEEHPGMREEWLKAAHPIAILHDSGMSNHGDFAPRNIGTDADGSVCLVDCEFSRVDLTPPRDAEIRFGQSYTDLSVLLESMCMPTDHPYKPGIGLFNIPSRDAWEDFRYLFFDEYVEWRRLLVENGPHHAKRKAQLEEELAQLEVDLAEAARRFTSPLKGASRVMGSRLLEKMFLSHDQ